MTFFSIGDWGRGLQFLHKNKLKSEKLSNNKKVYKKCLSAITKKIGSFFLKEGSDLRMKVVNIMGVHQFLAEGDHKQIKYRGNCVKRGLSKKQGAGCFRLGVDTPMHTMN